MMTKAKAKGQMRRNQVVVQEAKNEAATEVAEKVRDRAIAMENMAKTTTPRSKTPMARSGKKR